MNRGGLEPRPLRRVHRREADNQARRGLTLSLEPLFRTLGRLADFPEKLPQR